MTRKPIAAIAAVLATVSAVVALPLAANAQGWHNEKDNRQKTKNEWRDLAILGGAAAAYGAIKGDKTVGLIGAAGALYSLKRYEDDRKSQNREDRDRAARYDRPDYYQDGHRYERRIIQQNGERYYRYVPSDSYDDRKGHDARRNDDWGRNRDRGHDRDRNHW